jgi:hypothetical protein
LQRGKTMKKFLAQPAEILESLLVGWVPAAERQTSSLEFAAAAPDLARPQRALPVRLLPWARRWLTMLPRWALPHWRQRLVPLWDDRKSAEIARRPHCTRQAGNLEEGAPRKDGSLLTLLAPARGRVRWNWSSLPLIRFHKSTCPSLVPGKIVTVGLVTRLTLYGTVLPPIMVPVCPAFAGQIT